MTVEKYEQRLKKLEDMLEYQQKQIRFFKISRNFKSYILTMPIYC